MQKNIFYRYFTMLMAVLVLSSSIGVGLVESQCMMRGKTVGLAFKEKKKGCKLCRSSQKAEIPPARQEAPVFKKQHCCIEKQQLKIVDFQVTVVKQLAKQAKDLAGDVTFRPFDFTFLNSELPDTENTLPPAVYSFSSRYSGRSMLSFVQSFLI